VDRILPRKKGFALANNTKGEHRKYQHPELTDIQVEGLMKYWRDMNASYTLLHIGMFRKA